MIYLMKKLYFFFKEDIFRNPGRTIAFVFFLFLFILPIFMNNDYLMKLLTFTLLFALFSASWDFLYGFTGQLNLGHALFWGVSAYTAALLNVHLKLSPWATIPVGAFTAMVGGLIVCLPALRLRGLFLGLVTLALPLILSAVIISFPDITGGDIGIYGVAPLLSGMIYNYYLILVIVLILLLLLWKLTDTRSRIFRTGIMFLAIREDEISARRSGVNTTFYKAVAFAISAFTAGIAGSLYVHTIRIAGTSTLELMFSFNAIVWSILGGVGTIYGAVTGVFILYPLIELLGAYSIGEEIRFIIQSILLILILLFMPQGISTWVLDHIEEECPRCKLVNFYRRKYCRACNTPLHREKR